MDGPKLIFVSKEGYMNACILKLLVIMNNFHYKLHVYLPIFFTEVSAV